NENKPANVASAANASNANMAKPAAAPPTKDAVMTLEKGGWEAWKNRDAKWFEENLSSKYVGFNKSGRVDKAASIKAMGDAKCEVKSDSLSDERCKTTGA